MFLSKIKNFDQNSVAYRFKIGYTSIVTQSTMVVDANENKANGETKNVES